MTDQYEPKYPVSRETLYELAWSRPMTEIGKIFDVSSSYLVRLYTKMNVPRPAPGYWAKIAAGKTVSQPKLPKPKATDILEWDRYNDAPIHAKPIPKPPKRRPSRVSVPKLGKLDVHPLIRGAKDHFLKTRDSHSGYLRPYKRNLIDLTITKDQLDAALNVANDIFLSFEDSGYEVCLDFPRDYSFSRPEVDERIKPAKGNRYIDHWSPGKLTVVYVGTVAIGLSIFEYSEEVEVQYVNGEYIPLDKLPKRKYGYQTGWTTTRDLPTGRFCLRAYSPYRDTSWSHSWDLDKEQSASAVGQKIAKSLIKHANVISALVETANEEAEKRRLEWEEQERQWRIKAEKKRREEALESSQNALLKAIEDWGKIRRIEAFFDEVTELSKQDPSISDADIAERVAKAKKLLGSTSAFQKLLDWKTPEEILETQPSSSLY